MPNTRSKNRNFPCTKSKYMRSESSDDNGRDYVELSGSPINGLSYALGNTTEHSRQGAGGIV